MTREGLEDEYCQMATDKYNSFEEFLIDLVITYDKQIEDLTKKRESNIIIEVNNTKYNTTNIKLNIGDKLLYQEVLTKGDKVSGVLASNAINAVYSLIA
jgi:hypothetical protein